MINIAELLAAQARRGQPAPASSITGTQEEADRAAPTEYARAPAASGPQQTGGRPPATQRSTR